MDLGTLLADKPFLAQLSKEYELLKRSRCEPSPECNPRVFQPSLSHTQPIPGAVDYNSWIKTRLKQAAAQGPPVHNTIGSKGNPTSAMPIDASVPPASAEAARTTGSVPSFIPASEGRSIQPVWVSAANLQQSLAASPAVPLMHAAADRQRRLAVAAALARQHLLLGVQPGQPAVPPTAAATTGAAAAAPGAHTADQGSQQVLGLIEQIVQQNQQLQEAVLEQRDQLSRQEALLHTAIMKRVSDMQQPPDVAPAALQDITNGPERKKAAFAAGSGPGSNLHKLGTDALPEAVRSSWLMKCLSTPLPVAPGMNKQATNPWVQSRSHTLGAGARVEGRERLKAALRQLLIQPDLLLQPKAPEQEQQAMELKAGELEEEGTGMDLQAREVPVTASPLPGAKPSSRDQGAQRSTQQAHPPRTADAAKGPGRPAWDDRPYSPPKARQLRRRDTGHIPWAPPVERPRVRSPARVPQGSAKKPNRPPAGRSAAAAARPNRSSNSVIAFARQAASELTVLEEGEGARGQQDQEAEEKKADARLQQLRELEQRLAQLAAKLDQQLLVAKSSGLARMPGDDEGSAGAATAGAGGAGCMGDDRRRNSSSSHREWPREGKQQKEAGAAAAGRDSENGMEEQAPLQEQQHSRQDAGVLLQVLQAMEQLEQEEQEVRGRWFSNEHSGTSTEVATTSSRGCAPLLAAAAAHHDDQVQARSPGHRGYLLQHESHATDLRELENPDRGNQQLAWEAAPREGYVKEDAAGATGLTTAGFGASSSGGGGLTENAVASIKAGRRRFLKYQQLLDGDLMVAAAKVGGRHGSVQLLLQPTQVVEAVADLLLEELLKEQVQELDGWCNNICEQLFDAEFAEA